MVSLKAETGADKAVHHKSFNVEIKAANDDRGTFEATVAVFGNVDKGGDRIVPGAFTKSLAQWQQSGDPIPVILSHSWDNPFHHIGVVEEAKETDGGLWVKGRLDVADNDVAKQVHRLMSRRSLKEFSFGYSVPKGGERRAKDGANELLEIDLSEVGPTLKGMNPATELHAVKSALGVEDAPDPDELRKESERLEREVAEAKLPDVSQVKAEPAEPAPDLFKELQEVKERLARTEQALEDLRKKADVTDKEPDGARSVDPLRKRSEELALEVASDGMSLRTPPPKAPEPVPETVDPDALKARSRDLMFEVLSYSTE